MNNIILTTILLATTMLAEDITIRTTNALSSKTAKVGDTWVGTVANTGAPAGGIIEEVFTKSSAPQASLGLKLVSIDGQPVNATPYRVEGEVTHRRASRTVTGWALTGALVGGVLHGGKGAAVGAGAGAGVGAARAASPIKSEAVIPAESLLNFHLRR